MLSLFLITNDLDDRMVNCIINMLASYMLIELSLGLMLNLIHTYCDLKTTFQIKEDIFWLKRLTLDLICIHSLQTT